jgi:hypothetical protein
MDKSLLRRFAPEGFLTPRRRREIGRINKMALVGIPGDAPKEGVSRKDAKKQRRAERKEEEELGEF